MYDFSILARMTISILQGVKWCYSYLQFSDDFNEPADIISKEWYQSNNPNLYSGVVGLCTSTIQTERWHLVPHLIP